MATDQAAVVVVAEQPRSLSPITGLWISTLKWTTLEVGNRLDFFNGNGNRGAARGWKMGFLEFGNRFENHDLGSLTIENVNEMYERAKGLRVKYHEEVRRMDEKRELTKIFSWVAGGVASIGWCFYGTVAVSPVVPFSLIVSWMENCRKSREDAIKEKIKVVDKVRDFKFSCDLLQDRQQACSRAYKQLMDTIERAPEELHGDAGDVAVWMEMTEAVERVRKVMEKMNDELEKAKKLEAELTDNRYFKAVQEDLAAV